MIDLIVCAPGRAINGKRNQCDTPVISALFPNGESGTLLPCVALLLRIGLNNPLASASIQQSEVGVPHEVPNPKMASRHVGNSRTSPFDMWTVISQTYRVVSDIGYGRDGTSIKKAVERNSNQMVSLKVMPLRDEERRESCLLEACLLASVNHRNILTYCASYESSSEFVLVTEFCEGGDLLDRVNSSGKLSEPEAREYFQQLLSAVQYLHSKGIVHRDVKLDNIFLTASNEIKLGDFGFARHFFPGERFHHSCGTLVYVAPELLVPKPDYDPLSAEVYSLGITLFAICSAYLPYDSPDELRVIADVRRGGCVIPSSFSLPLAKLVSRLMSVQPSERPTLAEIRSCEWVSPSDRAQRSSSEPAVEHLTIEATRARSLSVPNNSRLSQSDTAHTPPSTSAHSDYVLPAVSSASVRHTSTSGKGSPGSWLYRKLVKPLANRISGGGSPTSNDLSTIA